MRELKWSLIFVISVTLIAIYNIVPSVIYFTQPKDLRNDAKYMAEKIPHWLPAKHVKLGLDLQGGVQLVLGVSTAEAIDSKLNREAVELTRWAGDNKYKMKPAYVVKEKNLLRVDLEPGTKEDDFRTAMKKDFSDLKLVNKSGDDSKGTTLDFFYDEAHLKTIKSSALEQAERVVRSRVDKWGVTEPLINRRADNSIMVQLPGFSDPEKAKELLGKTAQLKFKLLAEDFSGFNSIDTLPPGVTREKIGEQTHFTSESKETLDTLLKGKVPDNLELLYERQDIPGSANKAKFKSFVVQASTALSGDDIMDAYVQGGSGLDSFPQVGLKFTTSGSKRMADVSGENVGKRLAIILDDVVVSDPVLKVKITGGQASITLGGSKGYQKVLEEAQQLALILKSGALPAKITVLEERQVGASLGPELADQGIRGALVGLLLVFVFMGFYYMRPGIIACIALVLNAIYLLAFMAIMGFALTLPGIAGLILTLGMAVDANILINERIRQEMHTGKSARKAVEVAFSKVFWTIFDTHVTTLIAGVIMLNTNSSGSVRGFAVALVAGLAISMFTALYCTRMFFNVVMTQIGNDEKIRAWFGIKTSGKATHFNFLGLSKIITTVIVLLSLSSLVAGSIKGLSWGVDFAGGTELNVSFGKSVDPKEVRQLGGVSGMESLSVQAIGNENKQFIMRFEAEKSKGSVDSSVLEQEKHGAAQAENVQKLQKLLLEKLAAYQPKINQVDFVGPQVGKELRMQGFVSVFWAIIGVLLYIIVRFDTRFAPGAVIKMILDVSIMLAFYVFFWRTFDLTSVAAFLTIVGYSINDTIVIYDRIRENFSALSKISMRQLINESLNDTLTRSINTSMTVALSLLGMVFFTTGQLWDFAVSMLIGVISATITSTFVSSALLLWSAEWKKAREHKARAKSLSVKPVPAK